jgi:hypothetical protein
MRVEEPLELRYCQTIQHICQCGVYVDRSSICQWSAFSLSEKQAQIRKGEIYRVPQRDTNRMPSKQHAHLVFAHTPNVSYRQFLHLKCDRSGPIF